MRKTLVAREALKSAPLMIQLRYMPELFHKQLYSHVEILFILLFIIVTLSISFSPRPNTDATNYFAPCTSKAGDDVMNKIM